MLKNEDIRIQKLDETFQMTTKVIKRITSESAQIENEYIQREEYVRERNKYVLKQSILVAENKKYLLLQVGFTVLIPIVINYNYSIRSIYPDLVPFYRGFFLFATYMSCFAFCQWIWSIYKINYKVILDTPYQKESPVFWTSIFNIGIVAGCFLSLIDSKFLNQANTRQCLVCLIILQLFLGYRFMFGKIFRTLFNPFRGVSEFSQVFILDQICTLSLTIADIHYYICYTYLRHPVSQCIDQKNILRGFLLQTIPYSLKLWSTLVQQLTLNQQMKWYRRPTLYNIVRYSMVISSMWLHYRKQFDPKLIDVWYYFHLIASLMNFFWDIIHDWGLLRKKFIFPNHNVYALAILLNFMLRFAWTINQDPKFKQWLMITQLHPYEQLAIFSVAETIRRNIWNIFTLEKHQILLNTSYLAVRDLQKVKVHSLVNTLTHPRADINLILKQYHSNPYIDWNLQILPLIQENKQAHHHYINMKIKNKPKSQ